MPPRRPAGLAAPILGGGAAADVPTFTPPIPPPQVILVRDVPGLGSEGTLKSVPVGYWRNYLQPQGLAAFATGGVLEKIQRQREAEERAAMEEKAKAQAMVRACFQICGLWYLGFGLSTCSAAAVNGGPEAIGSWRRCRSRVPGGRRLCPRIAPPPTPCPSARPACVTPRSGAGYGAGNHW